MTAAETSRDRAGRALYEKGQALLPGLGQPPAPEWQDLDESVRERWRVNAEKSEPGQGPSAPAPRAPLPGSARDGAPHVHP